MHMAHVNAYSYSHQSPIYIQEKHTIIRIANIFLISILDPTICIAYDVLNQLGVCNCIATSLE